MTKYYLAAPYDCRGRAADAARLVSEISGWRCTSSWIDGNHPGSTRREQAENDLRDVRAAAAVVLWLPKASTSGGLWFEMGYAVAMGKPVIVVPCAGVPLPVFVAVRTVKVALTLESAARCLARVYGETL